MPVASHRMRKPAAITKSPKKKKPKKNRKNSKRLERLLVQSLGTLASLHRFKTLTTRSSEYLDPKFGRRLSLALASATNQARKVTSIIEKKIAAEGQ